MVIMLLFSINLAISAALLIFSVRSCSLNPKSLLIPSLNASPSSATEKKPANFNFSLNRVEMVVFPEPESPNNQITNPF
ncbi:hypothetical protein D3C85_1443250 [compost metagenome]